MPNRSPTPISKSNDFLGQSDDIWGARDPHFRPILAVPRARAGFKNIYCLALRNGHHVGPAGVLPCVAMSVVRLFVLKGPKGDLDPK